MTIPAADPFATVRQVLEATALAAMAAGLSLFTLALLLIPQRLAQRPASQGIVTVRLAADGQMRLWNQPVPPGQVDRLLRSPAAGRSTVRVVPDPDVPWGRVQQLMERLGRTDLPLELQLP